MSASAFNEDILCHMLPVYYNRIFPQDDFYKWLCYGDLKNFNKREISFTLAGDIYLRYQFFDSVAQFSQALVKRFPVKIDIGAVYKEKQRPGASASSANKPIERELIFDIDLTDFDDVRTCCQKTDVCEKCWKFMVIASKILDAALRDDFGYEHILWVFSGRRGIHCWIADKSARKLNDTERSCVAEYLSVIKGGIRTRKVKLPYYIPSSLERALKFIDEYFESAILDEQDILGTDERLRDFLSNIDENLRLLFEEPMSKVRTSHERWDVFEKTFQKLFREQKIHKSLRHMIEEMKLYYAYPRLDMNVTKAMNHLLKAPFCVHPKTGKVSVPFKVKTVDKFDITAVPTISQLLDEVNSYDAKNKAREQQLMAESSGSYTPSTSKIKEYKKTSLFKHVVIFSEFLRGLEFAARQAAQTGEAMQI